MQRCATSPPSPPGHLPYRLNILFSDWHTVKQLLARAKQLCESGGDWEHKNKLKVRAGGAQRIRARAAACCAAASGCALACTTQSGAAGR
jgi:hypothetical protein